MNNEETEPRGSRVELLNVIATYLIELNEHRAELYTALKTGRVTPSSKSNFFKSFKRFYDMTADIVTDDKLLTEIEDWFDNYNDKKLMRGIELSREHQKQLESIFPIFQMRIKPPYIE